jgi:PhnB protein
MTTEAKRPTTGLFPHIVLDGASDAIEFYKKAFGAEEMMRLAGDNGRIMHASVSINNGVLMMVDENKDYGIIGPKSLGGAPLTLHLTVPDVDASFARAVDAGGTPIMPPTDMFWGDRYGMIEDPFGYRWAMATTKQNLTVEQIKENAKKQMPDYAQDDGVKS